MSTDLARQYAVVVQDEARDHHFDPYTLVAMAHYESRWRAGANDGACYGLVGICLSNYPECRSGPLSAGCEARRATLVDGRRNLQIAADLITANRKFCRRKTGRAKFHHWLASYQGANKPKQEIWCGQKMVRGRWMDVPRHPFTMRVMQRRRWLIRNVRSKR
jgi:hypothetical protein